MDTADDRPACRQAHVRLLVAVSGLDDAGDRAPSALPAWTVGHVVAHLARNADSHAGLFRAAARGAVADQYPGGAEQRAADIAAGAGRPARVLYDDLAEACTGLEISWDACPADAWAAGRGRVSGGAEVTLGELVFRRWREIEVHHVDLAVGYSCDDWPAAYVRKELARQVMRWRGTHAMGLTELPAAALALPPPRRLAWLLGRLPVPGLPPAPAWG
jgi:maleylpyruvate isomerase